MVQNINDFWHDKCKCWYCSYHCYPHDSLVSFGSCQHCHQIISSLLSTFSLLPNWTFSLSASECWKGCFRYTEYFLCYLDLLQNKTERWSCNYSFLFTYLPIETTLHHLYHTHHQPQKYPHHQPQHYPSNHLQHQPHYHSQQNPYLHLQDFHILTYNNF